MPTYSVSVLGDELVSRNLMRMGASAENMQIPLTEVAAIVRDKLTDNFDDEGPGWAPLAPSTVASRLALGYPAGPILHRSGRMRRSLTGQGGDAITQIDGDSLALGSSVPYAGFHQTGTGTMPARPQRLPERTKRDAVKVLQRFLVEAGRGL
jgi:phage gpG-like protein